MNKKILVSLASLSLLLGACGDDNSSSANNVPEVEYASISPNAADLEVSGDTLFAVFQRYTPAEDGFTAIFNDPGLLALYKLSDGTLLDTVQLLTKNPMAVKVVKGDVYVASQGEYNDSWGTDADENRGIEKIDLKNKKSELWVSGKALGGGVSTMDVDKASGKAYVAVYKIYGDVPVVEVDLGDKDVKEIVGVADASGSLFFDSDNELLYIGDRGMTEPALRVFDGSTLKTLSDEDDLPTYSIAKAGGDVFVYTVSFDYTAVSGVLYWLEENGFSEKNVQFTSDTKLVSADDKLYVLDRSGKGSISQFDAAEKKVAWQKALDADNAYDIVAIDDKTAWVALYNTAEIRKISLTDGSEVSSIDTEIFCAKKK